MTSEEIQRILEQVNEDMKKINQTQKRVSKTLDQIKESKEQVEKFEKNYSDFQDAFSKALGNLANSIGDAVDREHHSTILNDNENNRLIKEHGRSQQIEINDLDRILENKKHITFLTGAGISAGSGIATFTGEGGVYTDMEDVHQLLSFENMKRDPQSVWDFILSMMKNILGKKQNNGHKAVEKIMKMQNIKTTLVTQNIDGLHNISNVENDCIYQVHGNGKYMRCWNNDCKLEGQVVRMDDRSIMELQVSNCQKCGQIMRPHVLLFDETYEERWYRKQKLTERVFDGKGVGVISDCLIVVGTELKTHCASMITSRFIKDNKTIIEINLSNVVKVGRNTHYILEKSEAVLGRIHDILEKQYN